MITFAGTRKYATVLIVVSFLSGGISGIHGAPTAHAADDTPIPAFSAFAAGCNSTDLGSSSDSARNDPVWTPVIHDANNPVPTDPPTILEGTIPTPDQTFFPNTETSSSQAPSEVAEEDLPWNHYTHDKTIDVVPDPGYKHLLSSWVDENGSTQVHSDMEVEWDSASLMGDNRTWGSEPEFVWPSVRDRVWIDGRWIFDCGHPGSDAAAHVEYSTEIHPPRGLVTFRLNHPVASGSWAPVTGAQTNIPVTEADMFFSGNGGGANDRCSLIDRHINAVEGVLSLGLLGMDDCTYTGPVIPINDRNYVFDIYPPGTNFDAGAKLPNGTYPVSAPTHDGTGSDVSLQWRSIDQSSQLPAHACGGTDTSNCTTVAPLLCPVDDTTPAPQQTETSCPAIPTHPTRLRVILPFGGSTANYFAQSILLGWDDVPAAPINPIRTFHVSLHNFTVIHNGESFLHDGDWRVFVDVGGQWRYISDQFDRQSNGDNACHGDALTENGDGDCFQFDQSPWTVSVQDGTPIHVAVGGWESDTTDSDFCRTFSGCDPGVSSALNLLLFNDDRIGTYEFDLNPANYTAPATFTTERLPDGEQYSATFSVQEVTAASPPTSGPLGIGSPQYTSVGGTTYVTSSTPLTLTTASTEPVGFQYRFHRAGTPLPTFPSSLPFPAHWTATDYQSGPRSVPLALNAFDGLDGAYLLQYSAQTAGGLTEARHTASMTLDNTAPAITMSQPAATTYTHSSTLTLNYSVDDGSGSGVHSVVPTIDTAGTIGGHGLLSGQPIHLLTELSLGTHTFRLNALDNLGNAGTRSVTFTIIVTAQSIKDDVSQLLTAGAIAQNGGTSLVSKLNSAAQARAAGNCTNAASIYQSFISEVQAQTNKKITATAASILITDAQYLIANCP